MGGVISSRPPRAPPKRKLISDWSSVGVVGAEVWGGWAAARVWAIVSVSCAVAEGLGSRVAAVVRLESEAEARELFAVAECCGCWGEADTGELLATTIR